MLYTDNVEKTKLYNQIRVSIGEPVRDYSDWVTDEIIDTHIEMAMEDYMSYLDNWLIEQQWSSLEGLNLTSSNFIEAFTTKSLDFETSFSIAYGKQTGISTLGEWELKSDYVTISSNTQVYLIPSGREVNEVLWYTPPQIATNIFDPIGVGGGWFGSPTGWFYGNTPAQAMLPSFSLMLSTMDRMQKKKIIQSELTYRIVPGPNKTKKLYLYPIPGSRDEIVGRFGKTLDGAKVWYFYYDTPDAKIRDLCLEENEDIVKMPSDVPIKQKKWSKLNSPTKNKVRRLAVAGIKKYLATIWAKTSGKIKLPQRDDVLEIDYKFFLDEAQTEKDKILTEVLEMLSNFRYDIIMERRASIARNLHEILKHTPPESQVLWM
jgi:hypothetical protein